MEYPGSTLTKRRRQLLLALFLASFVIITPLLVLYTVGYRYDWRSGLIKEIGALSVDALPSDAMVFLNNQKINEKIPVRLKNIAPNSYHLLITKPGYYDWSRDITIKSKQTVYIKDVTLIKKAAPSLVLPDAERFISASTDGEYFVYTTPDHALRLHSTASGADTKLPGVTASTTTSIAWSKNNTFFSVANDASPYTMLTIFKTNNPQKNWNIAAAEPGELQKYMWDSENDHIIYYSTPAAIVAADTALETTTLLTTKTTMDWYFNGGQLWTLSLNTSTNELAIDRDTLGFTNTFATIPSTKLMEAGTSSFKIRHIQNNAALLETSDANAMILTNNQTSFVLHTTAFTTSPTGWWLLWNPWELWSSLGGSDPYLLNRSSIALRQAVFIDAYNTVALRADTKLSVVYPYYLVSQDILENVNVTGLGADTAKRLLYFSATIENKPGIWKLEY